MRGDKMLRVCFLIFVSLALSNLSEAGHEKHLPAVLVGSVYCDTCHQQSFSKSSHFIPGADVAVQCSGSKIAPKFKKVVSTNKNGKFKVHLPFSVSKHVKKIKRCSVKLMKSSDPFCDVASTATSKELHFQTRKEGKHIFSAGFFTFKPSKQPHDCDQKPSVQESNLFESQKNFMITNPNDPRYLPPLGTQPTFNLPPIVKVGPLLPQLPSLPSLPSLPPLPGLSGIPFLPEWPSRASSTIKATTKNDQVSNQKVAQTQLPNLPPLPALPPLPPLPGFPFFPPWPPSATTTMGTTNKSHTIKGTVIKSRKANTTKGTTKDSPRANTTKVTTKESARATTTKGTAEKSQVSNQKVAQTQFFGPNPFRPPSMFPPVIFAPPTSTFPPTIPSPSTLLFPPIIPFPSTPTPSLFPPVNIPEPVPALFPTPLPPPPPVFKFPLPPFPFQPKTGLPGAPTTAKSISSQNSSP